jgi:hypothetical protein
MTDHDIIHIADRRARIERANTDRAIGRVLLCAAGAVGLYIAGSVIAALWAYAMGWV